MCEAFQRAYTVACWVQVQPHNLFQPTRTLQALSAGMFCAFKRCSRIYTISQPKLTTSSGIARLEDMLAPPLSLLRAARLVTNTTLRLRKSPGQTYMSL